MFKVLKCHDVFFANFPIDLFLFFTRDWLSGRFFSVWSLQIEWFKHGTTDKINIEAHTHKNGDIRFVIFHLVQQSNREYLTFYWIIMLIAEMTTRTIPLAQQQKAPKWHQSPITNRTRVLQLAHAHRRFKRQIIIFRNATHWIGRDTTRERESKCERGENKTPKIDR